MPAVQPPLWKRALRVVLVAALRITQGVSALLFLASGAACCFCYQTEKRLEKWR